MYAYQSIQDTLFLMLYGGVTIFALVASLYLSLRSSNAIVSDVTPPRALRWWTSVFFFMSAMSHVWWYVLGTYWMADDRLTRNIICIMLDHIMLVPLVMALLLRILQDRPRPIWPWFIPQVLVIGGAAMGVATHNEYGLDLMHNCQVVIVAIFGIYYIYALVRYSRWLNENYADLEHKEVWQSLLFAVVLFIVYDVYSTNPGEMYREYLSQVNTILIIGFLLWRVETLQKLSADETSTPDVEEDDVYKPATIDIGALLQRYCEEPKLYLQHDLTLAQLSEALGTNRTYVSQYFAQQGTTYNTYINRLRIEHFEQIYREAVKSLRPFTAQKLAYDCGFNSYSTFAAAFKFFNGQTVTAWMKLQ